MKHLNAQPANSQESRHSSKNSFPSTFLPSVALKSNDKNQQQTQADRLEMEGLLFLNFTAISILSLLSFQQSFLIIYYP
jgi:hypothetical protein